MFLIPSSGGQGIRYKNINEMGIAKITIHPSNAANHEKPPVMAGTPNSFKIQFEFQTLPRPPLTTFTVTKGLRYRFRVIAGSCASCLFHLVIENHPLTLIAADGDSLEPVRIDSAVMTAGEKYDFVLEASNVPSTYWIYVRGLGHCSEVSGVALLNYEGALMRRPLSPYPGMIRTPGLVFNPRNSICDTDNGNEVCITQMRSKTPNENNLLKPIPDVRIVLRFGFYVYTTQAAFGDGKYPPYFLPYNVYTNSIGIMTAYVNNITLELPPSPLLSQLNDIPTSVFCSQQCAEGSPNLCDCVNVVKAPLGSIVEFIVADDEQESEIKMAHPFHIHGYEFAVTEVGMFDVGDRTTQIRQLIQRLEANPITRENIIKKDTVTVPSFGYFVARIVANNPGFWFIHCHFAFHSETGMATIFQVGEPSEFPPVPSDFPRCHEYTRGNANPL